MKKMTNFQILFFISFFFSYFPTSSGSDVTCLAKNCIACQQGDSFKCATCVDGYYPDSQKNCQSCSSGCKTCVVELRLESQNELID